MDTQAIVDKVSEVVFFNKDTPHIEMEMRLGKFNNGFFDTNIGKKNFDRITDALEQYDGWEDKKVENTEVFYYQESGTRLTWNEDEGTQVCVNKYKILNRDFDEFKDSPYDLRFSVSQEKPVSKPDIDADRMIEKYRRSYIRKNLSIDMTIISGGATDIDDEEGKKYQVELEIIDPSQVTDEPKLFNIIHKVSDVLKILS